MRIITGKYKGRLLDSLRDNSVRPATDRVKGTIFNMLQNRLSLLDTHVLDLFAGIGSLGFEALSRGAADVVFVDENRHVLDTIHSNAQRLGCEECCYVLQTDALMFIGQSNDQFDLIFADPPYVYTETSKLPYLIFQRKLLKSEGFLIIEHDKRTIFEPSELYRLAVQKEFGNTRISFFVHPS